MKRMSIAEITIKKQIESCRAKEQDFVEQINTLSAQRDAIRDLRFQFEKELDKSREARVKASERFAK
jgi:hypothetical protein